MAYPASNVIAAYLTFSVVSIALLYGIAVGLGHVSPFVPHLGYLGDRPFESTVFTQLMVIKATVYAAVVQIQYVRVSAFLLKKKLKKEKERANTAGLCLGYANVLNLFILACFQETNAYWVHNLSLFMYLLGNVLYFCLQTYILKELKKFQMERLILSALMVFFFVTFFTGYILAVIKFQKPWKDRYHWEKSDGGWLFHIFSAVSEWILYFLFYSYVFSFYFDFRNVMMTKTRIIVLSETHGE